MSKWSFLFVLILTPLVTSGCQHGNTARTISTGSHVPISGEQWERIQNKTEPRKRFIVWGNHAGAVQAAVQVLQGDGHTVVERARAHRKASETAYESVI